MKNPWQKKIEKRTENIGFLSRTNAFREPTPFEKAQALAIETNSWQESRGVKPYTVSAEYFIPRASMQTIITPGPFHADLAVKAYMETKMDAGPNIDVSQYEPKTWKQTIMSKIKLYAPQAVAVSTLLLGIYLILKGMK